jgi:hypothetical protein
MRYDKRDMLGFEQSNFPKSIGPHDSVYLLHNIAIVSADDRLFLRLSTECTDCGTEKKIRTRLPYEINDYNYRAALAKLCIISGYIMEDCEP